MGVNKFECRTCPYQYVLDKAYYERTPMKRKEVEDVLGGKDEWKNADSMAGELSHVYLAWLRRQWKVESEEGALADYMILLYSAMSS